MNDFLNNLILRTTTRVGRTGGCRQWCRHWQNTFRALFDTYFCAKTSVRKKYGSTDRQWCYGPWVNTDHGYTDHGNMGYPSTDHAGTAWHGTEALILRSTFLSQNCALKCFLSNQCVSRNSSACSFACFFLSGFLSLIKMFSEIFEHVKFT